jgi:transcription termination factor Rho
MGHDVVVLLDSITRLKESYQVVGAIQSGTQSENVRLSAIAKSEQLFGAARNIEDGGSLTIIATLLSDTGLPTNDDTFDRFKTLGNMELWLRRDLAQEDIFPPIDAHVSRTRNTEYLMSPKDLKAIRKLRHTLNAADPQQALKTLIEEMCKTRSNAAFLLKAQKAVSDQSSPS